VSILVTGGATGIGRAVTEHFGACQHLVFVNYHSSDAAAADVIGTIRDAGGDAVAIQADLGRAEDVQRLGDEIAQHTDRLDHVVHCATPSASGPLLEIDPGLIRACLEVNPLALISVVRAVRPLLGQGSTVCYVSSQGALSVIPNYGPLGIAKALGEHIVRYLAHELAADGVRIFTVAPGAIDTAAFRAAFGDSYADRLAAVNARSLADRPLEAADIARAIETLSGSEFAMTFGDRIRIDGGTHL
jgi:enoyl-[acyl-carrier protein] reductase III